MARIKLAYIGGGSTRAPGTMASFIAQGLNFQGSEVVLIDLDAERLGEPPTCARSSCARTLPREWKSRSARWTPRWPRICRLGRARAQRQRAGGGRASK